MPRLTKEDLAKVKYVSMADFYNQLDKYEDFSDKLKFTSRYLLTHSSKQNPDYSIEEAIHLAKAKLVDEAEKQHTKYMKETHGKDTEAHIVNPYSKDDKAAEMFMANPVDYLVGEANKAIKEINDENIIIPEDRNVKVIIAGAGGAAHLPGIFASVNTCPVIGVPICSKTLNGVDSLYSIVQMTSRNTCCNSSYKWCEKCCNFS